MKILSTLLFSISLIILSHTPANASAIKLERVIVNFSAKESKKIDVDVTNVSVDTAYVAVEVFEVLDPGTDQENRRKVLDPKEIKLLVTPNKMIIPPKGHKLIRLVNIAEVDDKERIYRIKVAPIVGDIQAKETGVKVLIAYGMLVIVEPKEPNAELIFVKKGLTINFENKGNTNILLDKGKVCPFIGKDKQKKVDYEKCKTLEARRLYAGNKWTLTLPFDGEVSIQKSIKTKRDIIKL